jgi:hypothetical protein
MKKHPQKHRENNSLAQIEVMERLLAVSREYLEQGDWPRAIETLLLRRMSQDGYFPCDLSETLSAVEKTIVKELPQFAGKELHELPSAAWRFLIESGLSFPNDEDSLNISLARDVITAISETDIVDFQKKIISFLGDSRELEIYNDGSIFEINPAAPYPQIYSNVFDFAAAKPELCGNFTLPPIDDFKKFLEKNGILRPTEEYKVRQYNSPRVYTFTRYKNRAYLSVLEEGGEYTQDIFALERKKDIGRIVNANVFIGKRIDSDGNFSFVGDKVILFQDGENAGVFPGINGIREWHKTFFGDSLKAAGSLAEKHMAWMYDILEEKPDTWQPDAQENGNPAIEIGRGISP